MLADITLMRKILLIHHLKTCRCNKVPKIFWWTVVMEWFISNLLQNIADQEQQIVRIVICSLAE